MTDLPSGNVVKCMEHLRNRGIEKTPDEIRHAVAMCCDFIRQAVLDRNGTVLTQSDSELCTDIHNAKKFIKRLGIDIAKVTGSDGSPGDYLAADAACLVVWIERGRPVWQ